MKKYMAVSQFPAENQKTLSLNAYNELQEAKVSNKKKSPAKWQDIKNVAALRDALVFIDWLTKYAATIYHMFWRPEWFLCNALA